MGRKCMSQRYKIWHCVAEKALSPQNKEMVGNVMVLLYQVYMLHTYSIYFYTQLMHTCFKISSFVFTIIMSHFEKKNGYPTCYSLLRLHLSMHVEYQLTKHQSRIMTMRLANFYVEMMLLTTPRLVFLCVTSDVPCSKILTSQIIINFQPDL